MKEDLIGIHWDHISMRDRSKPVITLTTDFGWQDPYVGIMKGVILNIAPDATIVDITHGICSHDIMEAALILKSSCHYFPRGSIHVVVVDPGVGSDRRPLLAVDPHHSFVGPDNGVLSLALSQDNPGRVFHLTEQRFFLDRISRTFHGRDVFAPVAAWLSQGVMPTEMGKEVSSILELRIPEIKRVAENRWVGTVLRIDKFGNLITNIAGPEFEMALRPQSLFQLCLGQHTITCLRESYGVAPPGELFAIWGSAGWLEISSNQASAAGILRAQKSQEFTIEVLSAQGSGVSGSGSPGDHLPGS